MHAGVVSGAAVRDHVTGRDAEIDADMTVNATGPWSEKVAGHGRRRRADPPLPRRDARGARRLCNMVSTGSTRPATATSSCRSAGSPSSARARGRWRIPTTSTCPRTTCERMVEEGSKLIPAVRHATRRAAWSAARPLIGSKERGRLGPRALADLQDDRPRGGGRRSRASSRSPAARARRCAGWPRSVPTWSAASSGSTRSVGRATRSCCRTSRTSRHDGHARVPCLPVHARRAARPGSTSSRPRSTTRAPSSTRSDGSGSIAIRRSPSVTRASTRRAGPAASA